MSFVTDTADRIIFKSFNLSNEALGVFRISFALFLLLAGVPVFVWISNFPNIFYHPPWISIAALFSKFPPYWFLMLISLGTCLLSVVLLFGYKTRTVSLLLAGCILVGKSFSYSFDKINHDWLLWMIPLVMAFSNWGNAYSIDAKKNNQWQNDTERGWTVTLLALILCLAMFSAGLPKIWGGWLNPSTHAVQGHLLSAFYQEGRQDFLAPFFLKLKSPLLWEFFDYAAVLLEITFVFALIRPNVFRAYVFFAIVFHVLNLLMLNISFTVNCILYLLFIDWNMVLGFLGKHKILSFLNKLVSIKNMIIVSIAMIIFFFAVLKQSIQQSFFTISPVKSILEIFKLDSGAIIGSTIIFLALFLSVINIIYFFQHKKISNKALVTNSQ